MDINELSIDITGSKEESNFYRFIKEHDLDWKLGQTFSIKFIPGKFSIVGVDNSMTSVICQKFSSNTKSYDKRLNSDLERRLIEWTLVRDYAIFKNK